MPGAFPSPEEIFEDRYRIMSVINRGGFGRVYRAQQVELNRDVAIKVLQPITRDGIDADEESKRLEIVKKRFEREAQLVSQLRDSHTVVMHDFGTTPDGLLYMVLEYIDGLPLSQLIEEHGALAPERAVKIARQVLWSLQEAHALTMLHRDVKPQNIMVFDHAGRTDLVKVLDFGLAKSAESADFRAEDPDLTGDQVILGTPRYMSPEQIRGEPLAPSSDIYSLGLVMFEMLTGYKAVTGESTMNTLARHLNDVPIALPEELEIPHGLRDIVDRMLVKDASLRLQSAEDALDALEFWNSATSVLAGTSDPLTGPPAFMEERRKQVLIWSAAAVLSLFLLVAVAYATMREDPRPPGSVELDEGPGPEQVLNPVIYPVASAPAPAVVDVNEDEEIRGGTPTPPTVAPKSTEPPVDVEPAVIEDPMTPDVGLAAAGEPDASVATIEIDGGTLAEPVYPEPTEPALGTQPAEKKSTKTTNSGKKKRKLELDIGILK